MGQFVQGQEENPTEASFRFEAFQMYALESEAFIQKFLGFEETYLLGQDVRDACHQVQLGLQIFAFVNNWKGIESLKPETIDEQEPEYLKRGKKTLNFLIDNVLPARLEKKNSAEAFLAAQKMIYSRCMGGALISTAYDDIDEAGFTEPMNKMLEYSKMEQESCGIEYSDMTRAWKYTQQAFALKG